MKMFALAILFVCGLACIHSAEPAPQPVVPTDAPKEATKKTTVYATVTTRLLTAGKHTTDSFKTDYGSYDKNHDRFQTIEVSLVPFGTGEGEVTVECLWVGRVLLDSSKIILKRSTDKVLIKAGKGVQKLELDSGIVNGTDTKYAALGERYFSGAKIEGHYVRVFVDGKQVSDAGLDWLRDANRRTRDLPKLVKDFETALAEK